MEASTKPTRKQQRVLTLLNEGKTPKQIAKAMKLKTTNGVYQHMRRLRALGLLDDERSNGSRSAPAQSRSGRTSSNGRYDNGTIGQIDHAVTDAIVNADERLNEIDAEVSDLISKSKAIEEQMHGLKAEQEAVASRREQLAAVGK